MRLGLGSLPVLQTLGVGAGRTIFRWCLHGLSGAFHN